VLVTPSHPLRGMAGGGGNRDRDRSGGGDCGSVHVVVNVTDKVNWAKRRCLPCRTDLSFLGNTERGHVGRVEVLGHVLLDSSGRGLGLDRSGLVRHERKKNLSLKWNGSVCWSRWGRRDVLLGGNRFGRLLFKLLLGQRLSHLGWTEIHVGERA
jgi:hypothetical protein